MVGRIFIMFLCALLLIALWSGIGREAIKSTPDDFFYSRPPTPAPNVLLVSVAHVANVLFLIWVVWTVVEWFGRAGMGVSLLNHAAAMTRLGLPLRQGLKRCAGRLGKTARHELDAVLSGLDEGQLFGDAMSRPLVRKRGELRPKMLGLVSLAEAETLRAGEMSGNLGEAVALVVEGRMSGWRRSRALWGMAYSFLVLLAVAQAGVGFFVTNPMLLRMFKEFSMLLPPPTLLALAIGAPASAGFRVLAAVGVLWVVIGRLGGGWTLGRLPPLWRRLAGLPACALGLGRRRWLARVCHDLAMLLRVGTPAPRALEIVAEATKNPWRADRLLKAARLCGQGVDLGAALTQARVDPAVAWVAGVQTHGGEISAALRRLGDEYVARAAWAERVALEVGSLVVIAIAGLFTVLMAFGLVLPIWKLAASMG